MKLCRRLIAASSLVTVACGLLVGPLASVAAAAPSAAAVYENDVVTYANVERAKASAAALKANACLDSFAEKQARAMAKKDEMFHQDMMTILKKCKLSQVGENVAFGFTDGKTVTDAWMNSPSHKKNLLNSRHRLIGVGAYQSADGVWYVSQVMGRLAS